MNKQNHMPLASAAVAILLAASLSAWGPGYPLNRLRPKWYKSPSGEYRLHVDPSSLFGDGPGSYRLLQGEKELWSRTYSFTLWEAALTDDGVIAGYAYSNGEFHHMRDRPDPPHGNIRLVILDRNGKIRLEQSEIRLLRGGMHYPPVPLSRGLFIDQYNDRVVFRLVDNNLSRVNEAWRIYRLSTGEGLGQQRPGQLMESPQSLAGCLDAQAVPATPFAITHWLSRKRGARFSLVDLSGKTIWAIDLPMEYHRLPQNISLYLLLIEHQFILRTDEPRRFELGFLEEAKRVTFEVQQDPSWEAGWRVEEVRRAEWAPPIKSDGG